MGFAVQQMKFINLLDSKRKTIYIYIYVCVCVYTSKYIYFSPGYHYVADSAGLEQTSEEPPRTRAWTFGGNLLTLFQTSLGA